MIDLRDLTWLEGSHDIGPFKLRPLTWGSMMLAEVMELSIILFGGEIAGHTKQEIDEQVSLILWMQSRPVPEVLQAVRDGSWEDYKGIIQPSDAGLDVHAAVLLWVGHQAALLRASRFETTGKKSGKSSPFPTHWLARKVEIITRQRGWSAEHVLWELPLAQAEQIEQCIILSLGYRTKTPSAPAAAAASQLQAAEANLAEVATVAEW